MQKTAVGIKLCYVAGRKTVMMWFQTAVFKSYQKKLATWNLSYTTSNYQTLGYTSVLLRI